MVWFIICYYRNDIRSNFTICFANYFLKEMIRDKFLNRFKNLEEKFKKSEFIYLLIYRFVGGIPFQIQNIFHVYLMLKYHNFFWSTFLGMIPQLF